MPTRRGLRKVSVVLTLGVLVTLTALEGVTARSAGAAVVITEITGTPKTQGRLVNGPDGNLWFTVDLDAVARMTTNGQITTFTAGITPGSQPLDIATGPDGNLWFTEWQGGRIGRITPSGVITEFPLPDPSDSDPYQITPGPDGNLWFTEYDSGRIGRITPSGVITEFTAGLSAGTKPFSIVSGADGNLWFTEHFSGRIGRITPDGVITEFSAGITPGGALQNTTLAPDGNVWFTEWCNGTHHAVGKITPAGAVTEYAGFEGCPAGIGVGPDGNVWVTESGTISVDRVARVTLDGDITEYADGITPNSGPWGIVTGPDNNLWYSNNNMSRIGKITGVVEGARWHGLTPTRILDSRTSVGGWDEPLVSGQARTLAIAGAHGVPLTASSIVANVTVTNPTQASYLTVYPAGNARPATSNLNFGSETTTANLVTVRLGLGGGVTFDNAVGATDVVVDIVGYFDAGGDGDRFVGVNPQRMLDSRTALGAWHTKLGPGESRTLVARGVGAVPASASTLVVNVTVTEATAASFLQVYPTGVARPMTSNVNFAAGQTVANLVMVPIGTDGKITLYNERGATHVVADAVGYFDAAIGSRFYPLATPRRILDDRIDVGLSGPWGAGQSRSLQVAGKPGLPIGAASVIANVTVTNGTQGSFISVRPSGGPLATTSNLNFGPGETIPNLVVAELSPSGSLDFYNHLGTVDIVLDAAGYFAP